MRRAYGHGRGAVGPRGNMNLLWKSNTGRIIAGFAIGLIAGAWLAAAQPAWAHAALPTVSLVGQSWLHGLQMPLIPLMFALIVTGVCSAMSAADAGSMAGRLLLFFALLLLAATIFAAAATIGILTLIPIPDAAGEAIRASLSNMANPDTTNPDLSNSLSNIIPANPIAAAASGSMIQVVFFIIVFALAVAKIEPVARETLRNLFDALAKTMLVIIHWALIAAPLGVFALAFELGARGGMSVAGGLVHYVAIMVSMNVLIGLFSYPLAVFGGQVPLGRFVRAALPPQMVAASTQSSLATLPAMVEASQGPLGISSRTTGIVLPLAVATFRITSPSMNLAISLYCAFLFGVPITWESLIAGIGVAMIMTLASAGLPGTGNFLITTVPICVVLGVPVAALPLLMAVETIPDIFRTVSTVTMDLAVNSTVAARWRSARHASGEEGHSLEPSQA